MHPCRFAAFNLADRVSFTILINSSVSWVQWVRASFRFTFNLGDIGVIVSGEAARVLSGSVSHLSFSARNIISFHDIASGTTLHSISLGPTSLNIIDCHGVTDELGRCRRANFDISQLIVRIKRVISLPLGLELNDLRCSTLDVPSIQISLILIEVNMECTRARPINIPV